MLRADALEAGKPEAGNGEDSRGRLRASGRFAAALLCAVAFPVSAFAQQDMTSTISPSGVLQIALFVGITGAAVLSAVFALRERARCAHENLRLRGRLAELDSALQRSDALLNLRDQRVIVWYGHAGKPDLVGALPPSEAPEDPTTFLNFGRWLSPRSSVQLERATNALHSRRQSFEMMVETTRGTLLEVYGRAAANHLAVRFVSPNAVRREHAQLRLEHQRLRAEHDNLLGLVDALKMPVWMRDGEGRLTWVNNAYAEAVDAPSPAAAVNQNNELLGVAAREEIERAHHSGAVFEQEMTTVIGGNRHVLSVTSFAGVDGQSCLACDVSDMEAMRADHQRTLRSHTDTLDQLNTAVASFDSAQKLRFFNQAFQKLWELDHPFLDSLPDNTLLLDRLRLDGKLAEQPEWRRWKEGLLSAYRSVNPVEDVWHLPDGRTLRVVANPQPDGGVTWVFENLTEKINLESRYNAVVQVQGETLENLAEGVAVFGPDGRVRFANPSFSTLWGMPNGLVQPGTHIAAIRAACENLAETNPWRDLTALVTGFDDVRRDSQGQVELNDQNVLRYAAVHLPNGQTMITFVEITDSVNAARMLKDRNEALQRADQIKNDFIQHVSYELRSPLTNIVGFAELLAQETMGPLNVQQHDYVDHIVTSSAQLETIVDDILDLATVDAGIMELDIGEVPVEQTIRSAADLVVERLREHRITLEVELSRAPVSFQADEHRIRQILFNLLSNAANYAPDDSTVRLVCERTASGISFSVHDDGPGIPPDVLDGIFRRFESRANGGRKRGAGLGLSIVKSFVELHGGVVEIDACSGNGTTVTCTFPMAPQGLRVAAE